MPMLRSSFDALKPGGKPVIMTPSWVHHASGPFNLDYTHVTPFAAPSLDDAMRFAGFEDVDVTHFRQLPFCGVIHRSFLPVWLFSEVTAAV